MERRCQSIPPTPRMAVSNSEDRHAGLFPASPLVCSPATVSASATPAPAASGYLLSPASSAAFSMPNDTISNIGQNSDNGQPELPYSASNKIVRNLSAKKREFYKLRKKLIQQQNLFLEQYAVLRDLEKRAGHQSDECGEVRVLSVKGWPAHDLLMLLRSDINSTDTIINTTISGHIGPQVLQQLTAQLSPIPKDVLQLSEEMIAQRVDLLNYIRSKFRHDRAVNLTESAGKYKNLEWKSKTLEFDSETEKLHKMVKGVTENLKAKVNNSLELARVPWLDRESLIKRIERLQKENMVLQHNIEEFTKKELSRGGDSKNLENISSTVAYQALSEELAKEREARESMKDFISSADHKLRAARARIISLEKQLKDKNIELDLVKRKHKELEQLYRHRESSYDARSKKLMEMSKTGEITIETLSRQRDALELRVKELREQADEAERVAETRVAEHRERADTLMAKVTEQEKMKTAAENRVAELENYIKKLKEQITTLSEQSIRLVALERSRCIDYIPPKVNTPNDRETEIWTELQNTKGALLRVQEELRQCRTDKDNFLNSLSRIAQDEGNETLQDKMAAELVEREQKIGKLQQTIDEQRENQLKMVQAVKRYERQLTLLRLEVKRLKNYDCYAEDTNYQDLQTEILDMHMQVESLSRERTALVKAAASRALMLERHERAAGLFARMTRARRDLLALLHSQTEPPQIEQSNYSTMARSLSTVWIHSADTWSALQAERSRVLQLESAVLAQSLQLDRQGRVRTQLERRRAVLEQEISRMQTPVNSLDSRSISETSSINLNNEICS